VGVILKQQICGPKLPKTQQIDQIARIQNGYFWWKFSISQEQEIFWENRWKHKSNPWQPRALIPYGEG
jgi:hypothetical protein